MKKSKKLLFNGLSILIILIVLLISINYYAKNKIEKGLASELESSSVTYDDILVNILSGSASITNPVFTGDGIDINGQEIELLDLSYSNYIFNGNIVIGEIKINRPVIIIDKNKTDTTSTGSRNEREKVKDRNLLIKKISLSEGSVKVIENDSIPNSIFLVIKSLELKGVKFNESSGEGKIPFHYENVEMTSDSLYFDMNAEHYITVDNFQLTKGDLELGNLKIVPKFSKAEFDRNIAYEKDRIELNINSLTFKEFFLETENDSLVLKSPYLKIENANAHLFRNKLLQDDQRIKPMYSQMLRELGFKIHLPNIEVSNSKIVYEENVLKERPPGILNFANVHINIKNLSNFNMDSEDFPETEVQARGLFMGRSTFEFDWKFDIRNTLDQFTIQGSLGGIAANSVNSFLKPAMNVEIEGKIESLYFNFYGNRNSANGEMQLAYRDFKVAILKDGEEKKKSVLSGIANLFLKNDAVNEDISQENINVDRDKTKSFWNFLWLCIREGTIKTFL